MPNKRTLVVLSSLILLGIVFYFLSTPSQVLVPTQTEGSPPDGLVVEESPHLDEEAPDFPEGSVLYITTTIYKNIVASNIPFLIKFYSPSCPHCQRISQTWIDTAAGLKGIVHVGEINCNEFRDLCSKHSIKGVPTIVMMKGKSVTTFSGTRTLESFREFAQQELAKFD